MDKEDIHKSAIASELYFLIAKFLEAGPCSESSKVLKEELVKYEILPKRLDWEGCEHEQSYEEVKHKFTHIGANHLVAICQRIGPILDKEIKPTVGGLNSLLGAGRQSLLRTVQDVCRRWFHVQDYSVRLNSRPLCEPVGFKTHNLVKVLQGRENSGPLSRKQVTIPAFYSRLQQLCCTLGHLSAVYCLLFDNTGRYVITGADDLLVKVWSVKDGRLLATLRGASTEITDIAVNSENTLLAAGSVDKILRVWCLQSGFPVAVLTGHTGMITGVNFCPTIVNGVHYLVSTSTDGSIAFWSFSTSASKETTFIPKPILFNEKMRPGHAQMICSGFSAGGIFLAAGSGDHHVRIYKMDEPEGPTRVLEVEAHNDRVDSIQWAHSHLRFISGSKDGTANIWYYSRQKWMNIQLMMNKKLPGSDPNEDELKIAKTRVTMVSWDVSDKWVITAVADYSLKIWDAFTGNLIQVLKGHTDEVYCVESHPHDSRLLLSAGHDGNLFLWNILTGEKITHFQNAIEGQGYGAIFDAKWSPDGTMMAATDSHGQILMYALSVSDAERQVPRELFFHTDYRPLVRDAQHNVLDEQTNIAPHLMPPPFLVDIDGNPYPPWLQRLVPGREHCRAEQLIPNIILNASGQQEVIEGLNEPRANIDQMIQALDSQRQGTEQAARSRISTSPRSHMGPRRSGDVEGVRQSSGNWQQDGFHWAHRQLCEPLDAASLQQRMERIRFLGALELDQYRRESKRPPEVVIPTRPLILKKGSKTKHNYRTRAAREEQLSNQFEDPTNLQLGGSDSGNSSAQNVSSAYESDASGSGSSSDSSSSSVYSDWIADNQINLEPPKRSRQKRPPPKKQKAETIANVKKQLPQEVPEIFRPPEWLSEVVPKKSPYYPQMGDELVFFKDGYLLYIEAVRAKNVYPVNNRMLAPWGRMQLKEPEIVKVVGIKYEIKPPRLCCLRLAITRQNGRMTSDFFIIKYHDMPDVIDFLVLRQTYDTALARQWAVGDRFRSMIDDAWWSGTIESKRTDANRTPSPFLCFRVLWDNNERENLSPWDLEPCDPDHEPDERGGSAPVLPEEFEAILYHPRPSEWPHGDREGTCQRILRGLDQVMSMSIAEPFLVPVDISQYPTYAFVVEYPLDLSTIRARFENQFYRRVTAAQFDVRYLATNAEKFNEAHSAIVKHARIITDICLRIIKELVDVDVPALYRQLQESYHSSESEDEKPTLTSTRLRPSTSASRHSSRRRNGLRQPFEWKRECKLLLDKLWASKDSEPFREPVDRFQHPDYDKIIDTPMDLGTVRDELSVGNYENPNEFCKDIRRIFQNAKNYTPDKHTKIYSMTVRLSALAEEQLKRISNCYKNQQNSRSKTRINGAVHPKARSSRRIKRRTINPQPSTSKEIPNPLDCEPTSSGIRVLRPKRLMNQNEADDSSNSDSSDDSESDNETGESTSSESDNKKANASPVKRMSPLRKRMSPLKGRKRTKSSSGEEVVKNHVADSSRVRTRGKRQNYAIMLKSEESDGSDELVVVNKRQSSRRKAPVQRKNTTAGPAVSLRSIRRVRNYSSENSMNSLSNSATSVNSTNSQFNLQAISEADIETGPHKRKRRKMLVVDSDDSVTDFEDESSHQSRKRLQRGQRKHYGENSGSSDERNGLSDSEGENEKPTVSTPSVSSRGRIRKLTAKARACFGD